MRLLGKISRKEFHPESKIWSGEENELLEIELNAAFHPSKINLKHSGLWRYKSFLPESCSRNIISLGEGFTPMIQLKNENLQEVFIKLDHLNPSGSYKDRGASVMLSHIKSIGIQNIIQDSSGNAGASVAQYAAAAGINCKIFLPKGTSDSKIAQMKAAGAEINQVEGTREQAADQAFEAAKKSYYASHCYNPFFFQGTKTFAYEAFEQLNEKIPDYVILPAGNGTLIIGTYLGYRDIFEAGFAEKFPKIIAVQTKACNPLEIAFKNKQKNISPIIKKETLAEGISIANPVRASEILECIYQTDGQVISVSEEEILDAWKRMSLLGHFIESTSAATIAGLYQILPQIEPQSLVLSLFSGHGLKSADKIYRMSTKKNQ